MLLGRQILDTAKYNKYVIIRRIPYDILFYSERVQRSIETLPKTLYARFLSLADRMIKHGPNLGEPHTKAMKDGLFEMRLKGAEGIARVFYCAVIDRRIVMLHSFVKKTQKTPTNELATARKRLQEINHEDV